MKRESWFASNFCPRGSLCDTSRPLVPVQGPEIRSLEEPGNPEVPYLAEIRQFDIPPHETQVEWMIAEGQHISLSEYITLYPIIGYLYGSTASRELFPLPNLKNQPENNYFICVKGGRTPERP